MTPEESYREMARGVDDLLTRIYPGAKFLVVTVWCSETEDWVHIASNHEGFVLKLLTDAKLAVEENSSRKPINTKLDS